MSPCVTGASSFLVDDFELNPIHTEFSGKNPIDLTKSWIRLLNQYWFRATWRQLIGGQKIYRAYVCFVKLGNSKHKETQINYVIKDNLFPNLTVALVYSGSLWNSGYPTGIYPIHSTLLPILKSGTVLPVCCVFLLLSLWSYLFRSLSHVYFATCCKITEQNGSTKKMTIVAQSKIIF